MIKKPEDTLKANYSEALPSVQVASSQTQISGESLHSIVESYVRYYASGEGHTARAKRYDLQYFLEFLATSSGRSVESLRVSDWTRQETINFVDGRLSLGEAPATVSRRLATVKHLGRTLAERVSGYINPAREVKGPVLQTTRPRGLSEQEIELLKEAATKETATRNQDFLSIRNQLLLEMLLATGLRADEVRLLVVAQISEDFSWLKNVKTKGRKFRNVYLDTSLRPALSSYLERRNTELGEKFPGFLNLSASEKARFPVLISTYRASITNPMSFGLAPKSIWRIIAQYGKLAEQLAGGSISNLHPHKLRHTFAHGLLDSSKDVRLVAQALGHSDVRTTMRYTERTEEQLAAAIERKVTES